jgi:hypothetical protein
MTARVRTLVVTTLVLVAVAAAASEPVDIQIRLFDKQIYYLDRPGEIRLKVTVVNRGAQPYRFRLADDRVYNLDFEVKSLSNIQLQHSTDFTKGRSRNQPVFFRDIELQPGEEYAFDVTLDSFVKLDQTGVLTLQAFFYPDLFRGAASAKVASNTVAVHVRPAVMTEKEQQLIERDTNQTLTRQPIPPDEVVDFAIRARQQSLMQRFLLYLDVPTLMLASPEWKRRYDRLDEPGRRALAAQYQQELLKSAVDQDINVVPTEFTILNTQYTPVRATVVAELKFKYRDYTEVKEYTYQLSRRDKVWMIVGYEVANVRTTP